MVEHIINYKTAKFLIKETVLYRGAIYTYIEWIPAILYYLRLAEKPVTEILLSTGRYQVASIMQNNYVYKDLVKYFRSEVLLNLKS